MYVVIFRATIAQLDDAYAQTATRMRELALTQFGCLELVSVMEGNQEITLSYWPDEASIQQWKAHPEHVLAQKLGRQKWYADYSVQVANVTREYQEATQ